MIAELPSGPLDPEMARITGSAALSPLNQAQLDHDQLLARRTGP
jgi:hypothetical protein